MSRLPKIPAVGDMTPRERDIAIRYWTLGNLLGAVTATVALVITVLVIVSLR